MFRRICLASLLGFVFVIGITFAANAVTISFSCEPGSGDPPEPMTGISYEQTISLPANTCTPPNGKESLNAWLYLETIPIPAETGMSSPFGADTVLVAQYKEPKKYDVIYDCGNGSGDAPSATTASFNMPFTPAENTCTPPTGFVFDGWMVSGTEDKKSPETDFTWEYAENKTFTATWSCPHIIVDGECVEGYTITLGPGGCSDANPPVPDKLYTIKGRGVYIGPERSSDQLMVPDFPAGSGKNPITNPYIEFVYQRDVSTYVPTNPITGQAYVVPELGPAVSRYWWNYSPDINGYISKGSNLANITSDRNLSARSGGGHGYNLGNTSYIDGYTITWHDAQGTQVNTAPTRMACDEPRTGTVYAKWRPTSYNIQYELDGGEWGEDSEHPESATQDHEFVVSHPIRSPGYKFAGWHITNLTDTTTHYYSDYPILDAETGVYDAEHTHATSTSFITRTKATHFMNMRPWTNRNLTFTAKWECDTENNYYWNDEQNACIQIVTVTYNCHNNNQGGTGNAPTGGTYDSGTIITTPNLEGTISNFTEDGCQNADYPTIESWLCDGENVPLGGTFTITADTECVPNWTRQVEQIKLMAPDVSGWGENHHIWSWTYKGAHLDDTDSGSFMTTISNKLPDNDIPSRQGYDFTGYYSSGETPIRYIGADGFITDEGMEESKWTNYNDEHSNSWYAGWAPITYTIVYNLNGGNSWSPESSHPNTATYNVEFEVSNPTRYGYAFTGWNITGMDNVTHYYGTNSINEDHIDGTSAILFKNLRSLPGTVTFTAQWAQIPTYSVTYDCDGTNGYLEPNYFFENGEYFIPSVNKCGSKDGYTITTTGEHNIDGWVCKADGKDLYLDSTSGTWIYIDNYVCTAQWVSNTIKLQWSSNGESVTNPEQCTYNTDDDIATIAPPPPRPGYIFEGWLVTGWDPDE